MSWRDQLQPASFRGVKFKVDTAEMKFGRRNVVHEYPFRDEPYSEDLGKRAREYSFNAYIIGGNYFGARDSLIKAIEGDKSPGTLIHPTLGRKNVVPKDCSVNYSNREGGIEYFTLTFIEAGEKKFPNSKFNLSSLVGLRAQSLIDTATGYFDRVFTVTNFIDQVTNDAVSMVGGFNSLIDRAIGLGGLLDPFYSAFKSTFGDWKSTFTSLIPNSSSFSVGLSNQVTGLSTIFSTPKAKIKAQKQLLTFGNSFKSIPQTTPTNIQRAKNQDVLVSFVRTLAISQIAVAVTDIEFPSRQEAIEERNKTAEILDDEILSAGDTGKDEVYKALDDLRVVLMQEINERAILLPNLKSIRNFDSIPALVLSSHLYDDASRDQEIVDRNRVRNPLFLPSNTDLEVLS